MTLHLVLTVVRSSLTWAARVRLIVLTFLVRTIHYKKAGLNRNLSVRLMAQIMKSEPIYQQMVAIYFFSVTVTVAMVAMTFGLLLNRLTANGACLLMQDPR